MIKEDRLKDSVLDDSADIYKPRQQKSEKQKMSEMNFKEKVDYFKSYYLMKTIVITGVVALVIYAAYTILSPKPKSELYAAVINYAIDEETAAKLKEGFGEHLGIDPKKQEVTIDTSFSLGGDASEYTVANEQKFSTYLYASQLDVIVAPESYFKKYAGFGYLSKLTDELPTDLCTKFADSFLYATTEDDKTNSPYGIYLDGAKIYDKAGNLVDKPVIGIVANSKNKTNDVEFIKYLFQFD